MGVQRRLRVGDRVYYESSEGRKCLTDLGVVAEVVRAGNRQVAVVVWDTGEVDEFTLHGRARRWDSGPAPRVRRTGHRWSRPRTKVQLHRAVPGELDAEPDAAAAQAG